DAAVDLRREIGKAARHEALVTAAHLGFVWRIEFERSGTLQHGLPVDAGDGGKIGELCGTDRDGSHQVSIAQKQTPRLVAGASKVRSVRLRQRRSPKMRSRNRKRLMKSR